VLQVRRRSRADEAGLREGDVLLTVNGKTCGGLSCSQAMDLVESSGQNVTVRVRRFVNNSLTLLIRLQRHTRIGLDRRRLHRQVLTSNISVICHYWVD